MNKRNIPFDFILEELGDLITHVKPMFGCHAFYQDNKLLLIVRQKDSYINDNGVWVAMPVEEIESLRKEISILRNLELFNSDKPTTWQNIPESDPAFEDSVFKIIELIKNADPRIGKIPKSKKIKSNGNLSFKKNKTKTKTTTKANTKTNAKTETTANTKTKAMVTFEKKTKSVKKSKRDSKLKIKTKKKKINY